MSNDVVLSENLIQLMPIEPRRVAQSISEMEFALSLVPCGTCGTYEINMRKYKSTGRPNRNPEELSSFGVECHCPKCGQRRQLISWTVHDPQIDLDFYQLTSNGPSNIIEPWQLMAELDRIDETIARDPSRLTYRQWAPACAFLTRALTCAAELQKFAVAGQRKIVVKEYTERGRAHRTAHHERYFTIACNTKLRELTALDDAYNAEMPRINAEAGPPKVSVGEFSFTTIRAHEEWLKRGRQGEGRIILKHQKFEDKKLSSMEWAEVEDVAFQKSNAYGRRMIGISMTDVTFDLSYIQAVNLTGAVLRNVTVRESNANVVYFNEAKMTGCHFEDTELAITRWHRAVVEKSTFVRCMFTDARFADATFRHCDFQGNFMGTGAYAEQATTAGARFEDCDFSRTGWKGRDLSGATFVRCKFAGAGGSPRAHANLVLLDCDMSVDELLAMLATWEENQRTTAHAQS
jgi:uncharacterized protein YjbI with pentapeptide repeats